LDAAVPPERPPNIEFVFISWLAEVLAELTAGPRTFIWSAVLPLRIDFQKELPALMSDSPCPIPYWPACPNCFISFDRVGFEPVNRLENQDITPPFRTTYGNSKLKASSLPDDSPSNMIAPMQHKRQSFLSYSCQEVLSMGNLYENHRPWLLLEEFLGTRLHKNSYLLYLP
jgi:hypothetical protein